MTEFIIVLAVVTLLVVATLPVWWYVLPPLANFNLRWRLAVCYKRQDTIEHWYQHKIQMLQQKIELQQAELDDTTAAHVRVMKWVEADTATAASIANYLAPVSPDNEPKPPPQSEYDYDRPRPRRHDPELNGQNPRTKMTTL